MNKNKQLLGACLTILVACLGDGAAYAKTTAQPTNKGEPVKTQNVRQKTPHSDRKTAAVHLKSVFQQHHKQQLHDTALSHQGYTGQGKRGGQ